MLKIEVTAEDIGNGKPEDCANCPIALAIKRTLPGITGVHVSDDAEWHTSNGGFYAELPHSAAEFIARFDSGRTVFPFDFQCDPETDNGYYGDDD